MDARDEFIQVNRQIYDIQIDRRQINRQIDGAMAAEAEAAREARAKVDRQIDKQRAMAAEAEAAKEAKEKAKNQTNI